MATEHDQDAEDLARALVGEKIAAVVLERCDDGGTSFQRLTLTTESGRTVVLTTMDAEQYASWLNVETS